MAVGIVFKERVGKSMEELFISYHRRPDGGRQRGLKLQVDLPESIGCGDGWRFALPCRAELLQASKDFQRLAEGYEAVVSVMLALTKQCEKLNAALEAAQDQIKTLADCRQDGDQ